MINDRDKRRLLADILAEESDLGLRNALFGQTLRLVRRQRRFRAVRRGGSATLLLVLAVLLSVRFIAPRPSPIQLAQPRSESGYALVRTQPLDQIVTSQPFLSSERAESFAVVPVISTSDSRPSIIELSDDQLLDLTSGSPVALMRSGAHQAELIFANHEDREKLFHN